MNERWKFGAVFVVFLAAWFAPVALLPESGGRWLMSLVEAAAMLHEYAREHVLLCLVPAFFIAGAISVFVSQAAVMKYLGATASKLVAYPVAAVSGTILAVCSCTVLPLFSGIHKRGAGLGPAIAFLYAGPAINVLAMILTARVLGVEMGVVRAVAAIVFSVVIGLAMHVLYRKEEQEREAKALVMPVTRPRPARSGRTGSTSPPWSPSWCSPTGASRPRERSDSGPGCSRESGLYPASSSLPWGSCCGDGSRGTS